MVRAGASKLIVAENSIEQAFGDVADLAAALAQMRLGSDMSVMHGQEAIHGLTEVMMTLAAARGQIIAVHKALDQVKTNMGCARMEGTGQTKPDNTGVTQLRAA